MFTHTVWRTITQHGQEKVSRDWLATYEIGVPGLSCLDWFVVSRTCALPCPLNAHAVGGLKVASVEQTGPKITRKKRYWQSRCRRRRGVGCGEGDTGGVPPPHWGRGLGRGQWPLPRKKNWFCISKWRLLVHSGRYFVQFSCTFSR